MKKGLLFGILFILVLIGALSFIAFPKTGFSIQTQALSQNTLENLKLKAQVECLQNSQCSENQECMENRCMNKNEIDVCQNVKLSTASRNLKEGDSINSIKSVLTKKDLSYLLSDGELVEIVKGGLIEYFYSPVILIGNNKIENENGNYVVKNDEPLYTYKLTFSNPVDFSNKNIQGQAIRIFGEEYIIKSNSDDSEIKLSSKNNNLNLKNKGSTKIIKDNEEKVIAIEIDFNSLNKIKVKENYSELFFNKTRLSFDNIDNEFADVKIGGNC